MHYKFIETEVKSRIGYLKLNRLDKKNALNFQFVEEIKNALSHWANSTEVRAIILASNSDVFSAGADLEALEQMQKNTYEENLIDSNHLKELFEMILNYPKLTIAQVEGHAIAGGSGLATVCDFCFSVPNAKFGYTEVKIGFVPALVSIFLIRKIGEAAAKPLLLTGKLIDANEMKKLGLVNEIFEEADIKMRVFEFAQTLIQTTSPQSIAATKLLINSQWNRSLADALSLAAESNATQRTTDDCKKGIASFLKKEKLEW